MNGTDIAGEEPHMASQSDDSDKTKGVVVEKEESGAEKDDVLQNHRWGWVIVFGMSMYIGVIGGMCVFCLFVWLVFFCFFLGGGGCLSSCRCFGWNKTIMLKHPTKQ